MTNETLDQGGELFLQDGFWKLRWHQDLVDANGVVERHSRIPAWIGPATGPERLTKEQAQRVVWQNFLSRLVPGPQAEQALMTVAAFVQEAFVPEHVASKHVSGRIHYQAILKHVLRPEQVDQAFSHRPDKVRTRLKEPPEWPYLGNMRLCDVRHEDVQRLISAARARGYSAIRPYPFPGDFETCTHSGRMDRLFQRDPTQSKAKLESSANWLCFDGSNYPERHWQAV